MEKHENRLGDIFGQMRVPKPSPGHAVNPRQMPPHQIGERRVGTVAMLVEQFNVGHLLYDCRGTLKRTVLAHGVLPLTLSLGMSTLSFDIDAVITGKSRLSDAQALELYQKASTHDLGSWALAACRRLHPEDYRTYVIDRNINYTNVCTAKCTFCAFRRDHEDADAYTLSFEQIGKKISELVSIGGTQILMQGGMNDRLRIEYYEDLLRYIKTNFPSVHIHAFSPPEFVEFERFFGMDVRDIIRRLHNAGLDTIPGGGGEIFNPRVRRRIGIGKCTGDDWLRVMRVAHEEGMNTSATMLIGHIEFVRERIEHLSAIRDMQDYAKALPIGEGELPIADCQLPIGKSREQVIRDVRARWPGVFAKSAIDPSSIGNWQSAIGNYTAFIHWPFQRENTPLGRASEWDPDVHGPFDESTNEDILPRPGRPLGWGAGISPDVGDRPAVPRQHSISAKQLGDDGPEGGAVGDVLRSQRHGQRHDGGKRRQRRRDNLSSQRAGDLPPDPRRRLGPGPARPVLQRPSSPRRRRFPDLIPQEHPPVRTVSQIGKQFIGSAPGLDDGSDRSAKVQLPILGGQ